jgi:hypothetical protein
MLREIPMSNKNIYKSVEGEKAILNFYENVLQQWPIPYEGLILRDVKIRLLKTKPVV